MKNKLGDTIFNHVRATSKQCTKCGEVKELDRFCFTRHGRYGRNSICKVCFHKVYPTNKAQRSEYYKKNKDKFKAYKQTEEYKIKKREWDKKYYQMNTESVLQHNRQHRISRKQYKEIFCRECGEVFVPGYGDFRHSFCCLPCGEKYHHRVGGMIRRLRKYDSHFEKFDPLDVLKRDKWICQLCKIKTPKNLRGTQKDNAPEVDHIIPLSEGGEHTMRNAQCLCRKCNAIKFNQTKGQLRLFG